MPMYEFECYKCKKTFEHLCHDYTTIKVTCPYCKSEGHKILSLSNFKLNGVGWEKDGYCGRKDK